MSLLSPPPRLSRKYKLFVSHAWNYKDEYERVVALLNADSGFGWENLSVPECQPLPLSNSLPKSYRFLVRQLDERISSADCLLVLAGMYVAHSGWIQSEIEAAKEFRKPIIAVEPRGQERFPEAVRQAADDVVGWTGASMISAVRRLVGPQTARTILTGASLADLQPPPSARRSLADLLYPPKNQS
jgi:hypothetical protein